MVADFVWHLCSCFSHDFASELNSAGFDGSLGNLMRPSPLVEDTSEFPEFIREADEAKLVKAHAAYP